MNDLDNVGELGLQTNKLKNWVPILANKRKRIDIPAMVPPSEISKELVDNFSKVEHALSHEARIVVPDAIVAIFKGATPSSSLNVELDCKDISFQADLEMLNGNFKVFNPFFTVNSFNKKIIIQLLHQAKKFRELAKTCILTADLTFDKLANDYPELYMKLHSKSFHLAINGLKESLMNIRKVVIGSKLPLIIRNRVLQAPMKADIWDIEQSLLNLAYQNLKKPVNRFFRQKPRGFRGRGWGGRRFRGKGRAKGKGNQNPNTSQ